MLALLPPLAQVAGRNLILEGLVVCVMIGAALFAVGRASRRG
ncbi:hypothetical protein [Alienimonas chondri]|uniref:Uncharacterized protein n=1 Tax=Alienimonas chondri TaxID=2681879 RepID=A0ABX1VCX4_9PLAN|nr:hypothetical protein [Alienimonas chondri]NNJ25974.1 hypothetical protein [Alienimonas chondri]